MELTDFFPLPDRVAVDATKEQRQAFGAYSYGFIVNAADSGFSLYGCQQQNEIDGVRYVRGALGRTNLTWNNFKTTALEATDNAEKNFGDDCFKKAKYVHQFMKQHSNNMQRLGLHSKVNCFVRKQDDNNKQGIAIDHRCGYYLENTIGEYQYFVWA